MKPVAAVILLAALTPALAPALAACGGTPPPAAAPTPPDVDPEEAEAQARAVIDEVHQALARGAPQGLLPVLAEDVFVAGPGPDDLFVDRSRLILALSEALGGRKHKLAPKHLRVTAAPGGRAAWATEEVTLGRVRYAVTATLADVDDIWVIRAVHVARLVPDRQIQKAAAEGTLRRPGPLPAGVAPAAQGAADLLRTVPEAEVPRAELMAQLAPRDDVVLVGSAPGAITRGAGKIQRLWNRSLKRRPSFALKGELRAGASPDGALAWVCSNLALGAEGAPVVPHRAFYVYERADDAEGGWLLVAAHEAVMAP
jgi:ketosteroid isomerase-like protein